MSPVDVDLRCSSQARRAGVEPLGTAGSYDTFLLVELPLPWPKEVIDHAALAGIEHVIRPGERMQGVVPSPDLVAEGRSLVVSYAKPHDGPFSGYERRELSVPLASLAQGCRDVSSAPIAHDDVVTDLLVCTHGTRDRCCGALGVGLFSTVGSRTGLRVRRTSHTGGHRFAPTAILLPHGTVWGWLDERVVEAILERTLPPSELLGHYRGSAAMATPDEQVAEGAVFAEVGWSWLDQARTASVIDQNGDRSVVRIEGAGAAWEATVDRVGTIPQAVCGVADPEKPKFDPVLRLVELRAER